MKLDDGIARNMQLIELRLVQLLLKLQLPPQRSLERLLRLYCNPLKKSLAPYIAWFKVLVESDSDSASGCSEGKRIMDNFLASDDLHYMIGVLRTLGLHVEEDKALKRAIVEGYGGQFLVGKESKYKNQLFLGNAGTSMRPIIACGGGVIREPNGDLVADLKQLGADVDCFLSTPQSKLSSDPCNWKARASRREWQVGKSRKQKG